MNYTVSLRKRSDKWCYQIMVHGKYHSSKSGFATKMEAKRAGDKAAQRIKAQPVESKLSFKAIGLLYIADGAKEPSTIQTYTSWLENYKAIHATEITKLTYGDVAPIIHEYYVTHKYNGTKSLLEFGKAICKFAIEKLDVDMKNPFIKIKIEKKNDKMKKEHRILTMLEMKELFEKIEDPELRFLTMCFGLEGLRLSEARGLTYEAIGKDDVKVKQQRQEVAGKFSTKKKMKSYHSFRTVPLHPDLDREFKKIPRSLDKSRLIIEKIYTSTTISDVYDHLGYDGLTAHSLRHSFATACLQNGMDFKTLAQIMGDTVAVVMSTYSHVNTDMEKQASKILTNL